MEPKVKPPLPPLLCAGGAGALDVLLLLPPNDPNVKPLEVAAGAGAGAAPLPKEKVLLLGSADALVPPNVKPLEGAAGAGAGAAPPKENPVALVASSAGLLLVGAGAAPPPKVTPPPLPALAALPASFGVLSFVVVVSGFAADVLEPNENPAG